MQAVISTRGRNPGSDLMEYLVDTNWIILHLRGNSRVTRRIAELTPKGIGLSIVSMSELHEGVYRASNPEITERNLQLILSDIEVVQLDDEVCRMFGPERGRLRAANALIGDADLCIGATALRHGLTLLTNNTRHFERMEGLSIVSA